MEYIVAQRSKAMLISISRAPCKLYKRQCWTSHCQSYNSVFENDLTLLDYTTSAIIFVITSSLTSL